MFYCFTSSASPFEMNRGYSPFAVYAMLQHDGDYSAAASALRSEGYGAEPSKAAGVDISGITSVCERPGHANADGGLRSLLKFACRLRARGFEQQEILDALRMANDRCDSAHPEAELKKLAREVAGRAPASFSEAELARFENAASPEETDLVRLDTVERRPLQWLWPGRLPIGKLTMFSGDPGLGKSLLTLDITSRISTGTPWPDVPLSAQMGRREPSDVLLLSAEDDLADTIAPRLDAARADSTRIHALRATYEVDEHGEVRRRPVDLKRDVERLDTVLERLPRPRLVVVDPVSAYLGETDSHVNAEVRAMMAPLSELAERHEVALLCVSHLRKSTGRAIYRTMGSLAFTASARQVLAVAPDPDDETERRRLLLPVKTNLTAEDTGMAYRIAPHALDGLGELPVVEWERTPVPRADVDALVGGETQGPGRPSTERDAAAQWLEQKLADGPVPSTELKEHAEAEGFSARTLRRAKNQINAEAVQKKDGWYWTLENAT